MIPHCFYYSSSQGKFLSLQGKWPFCTITPVNDRFPFFIGFLISHECDHSFGSLLPLLIHYWDFLFSPYIIWGNGCPPYFSIWLWTMLGTGSWGYSASTLWSGKFGSGWEGHGWFQANNWQGAGMVEDEKEAAPNNNYGADPRDFASTRMPELTSKHLPQCF